MSQEETDPGASTDRFRAFVESGEAGHQRRRPRAAIGIVSLLLVLALVALLGALAAS